MTMVGETISHYRLLEELGGGAMGVVYKAQDTRLKRLVALKFLPPALTRDESSRQRFVQEAEAASTLDHPHVCTIHDIETTSDARVFIVMAFYEGETLKKRIQSGPLPIDQVVTIGRQIAEGLAAAHDADIVHRDIKPANVMITARGEVKIVDFGIAKLSGQSDLTGTGMSVGTVAYMAPEQFEGRADARSDVWALGVVMYEMLTGYRPFAAENDATLLNAILHRPPPPLAALRRDVPAPLTAIVERALQKRPADRFASAAALREALAALQATPSATAPVSDAGAVVRALRRPMFAVPLVAAVAVVGYLLVSTQIKQGRHRWAREEALPQIAQLLQRDQYDAAHALAQQAERYIPNDPVLASLLPQITATPRLVITPAGARVSMKPYASPEAEWRPIGTAPLEGVTLTRGTYRWRVEADGFEPAEFAGNLANTVPAITLTIALAPAGRVPPGMVSVPGGRLPVRLSGFATEDRVVLEPFVIGRHEVTNGEFKEFVTAGGYGTRDYWKHDITRDGRLMSWDEAMSLFRDSSGRPGPATWELGDYPAGQADYPVTGVSWYEAAAYAQFRGANLPTIYHWARAALEGTAPMSGLFVAASNFSGTAPRAVRSSGAIGPSGTYDMAGNAREWCANGQGGNRWVLGGAWNDYSYMYINPYSLPALDRSATNGFRLARYSETERIGELTKDVAVFRRDYRTAKPVADDIFEVFKRQFAYEPSPPNPKIEETNTESPDWVREKVSLDTGYGERLVAYVFVPKNAKPPFQTGVHSPGLTSFLSQASSQNLTPGVFDFVVKSGRILVLPVFKGTFERYDPFATLTGDRYLQVFRERMHQWRQETGQLLDYLSARPDVQADRLAYFGVSFGSSVMLPVLAMEPRYKAAVLALAGLSYREMLPEVDAVNFAPRITIPTLLLEGRYDHLFPVEISQRPLLALLGSPADQKRLVPFDAGHGPLPRGQMIHETLTWLDRFLGPLSQ